MIYSCQAPNGGYVAWLLRLGFMCVVALVYLFSPLPVSLSWLLGLARMSLLESEVERTADSGQDKAVEDANCIYVFM